MLFVSADSKPTTQSSISNEKKGIVKVQAIQPASPKLVVPIAPPVPAYLKAIGIPEAWATLSRNVTSTIAIVDTGVDFNNPELKPYLLEGKNLVDERKTAQDDNGHGTAVTGIITAIATVGEMSPNDGRWKGYILPVKALDQFGSGDEEKLTQGIRYAVDQGADIIVLSLGLRRDAPSLREAVAYAEEAGVLLIAASGNDAAVFGAKAAVQYPAAYPTVVAVAGSDGLEPIAQSTSGSENDISAMWKVQTLTINGGSIEMEGTSMAAPQVAATAAMLMAIHPDWEPVHIREALRRSAQHSGKESWNPSMGYGLISASRAIQADEIIDWREPNHTKAAASVFPLGKEVTGRWKNASDTDWYTFEAPYSGIYEVAGNEVRLSLYDGKGTIAPLRSATEVQGGVAVKQWPVAKGRYWLQVQSSSTAKQITNFYRLESVFTMNPDAKEPNNSAAAASTLPPRSQTWTGTFHTRGDVDWFVVKLPKPGMIRLTVTPDTTRIDPQIGFQPAGGTEIVIDDRGDGGVEQWTMSDAKAGRYFIRISNAVSSNPMPVIGTYTATLEYITEKEDSYEPNESPLTSTPLSINKVYNALIHTAKDQDWYRFTLTKKQKVKLTISNIPNAMAIHVELRNKKLQTLEKWKSDKGQKSLLGERELEPGTYYVKITADGYNRNQYYGLRLQLVNN
ncbi:S8 family serine peptidase [Cohnella mopanensis]|uniref:S8 family serine peptidase n=1 Tax=Cohnella mopanensis TaxID=2911966 RepID=UPI001EF8591E|nr:S8 family serine peptidase [Cohnella mopanensis]